MSYITHKTVNRDFEILTTFEAGLELFGFEVKAIRAKLGKLEGSRIVVRGGEAFLVGASVPAIQPANAPKSYDPSRTRRLLLKKGEIFDIASAEGQKGLAIVPISLYNKGSVIKLSLGIARGKKKQDKREDLKKRDAMRDMARELKNKR
jgi:SsrA-binding protein